MSAIRFLISSSANREGLKFVYRAKPGLEHESYARQRETLAVLCLHFWKRELESTGNWVIEEIVANAELMQKQWACEHGVKVDGENWLEAILERQIQNFRPEVWFCHSHDITPAFRLRMRQENPQLKYVFGYDGIDSRKGEFFTGCDAIVVLLEESRTYYETHGYRSYIQKLGFDRCVLAGLSPVTNCYPVSFVGGLDAAKRGHHRRLRLLDAVARELPLSVFTRPIPTGVRAMRRALGCLCRFEFPSFCNELAEMGALRRIHAINRGPVFGMAMFQTLANSGITLNCHIDAAGNHAANYRLFEATGVGACLVTDWKEDLPALFEPEREVVTYRSAPECVEKVRYLLTHESERQRIGARGQKRTLREHTLAQSNLSLMEWIQQQL